MLNTDINLYGISASEISQVKFEIKVKIWQQKLQSLCFTSFLHIMLILMIGICFIIDISSIGKKMLTTHICPGK